jgi:hypothetical protein
MKTRFCIIDRETGEMVEGGFFSRGAADTACARWNADAGRIGATASYYVAKQV